MRTLSTLVLSLLCLFGSGCVGLSIGGTTQTADTEKKSSPAATAKDYDLSINAEAAFLNDDEVRDAFNTLDKVSSEETLGYRNAKRTLDRRAAYYRAKYPKKSSDSPAPKASEPPSTPSH